MKLFDTHAHFNDRRFQEEADLETLLPQIHREGVEYIVNNGTDLPTCHEVLELSKKYDFCYAALGIHPEELHEEEQPEDVISEVEKLILENKKAVAVGEIGLDYHFDDNPPKKLQMEYMEGQLELARKLKKPVVIHDRDAHGDTFDLLLKYPDVKAVLHSYSGSPEMARQYVMKGNRYISFSGVLTFKNAVATVETAKIVPNEYIFVETDCPYLAPVPFRGKLNHSGLMHYTLERLAEIKGLPKEEMAEITLQNAKRFFEID